MSAVERRTLLKTTAGAAVGGPFAGLVARSAGAHVPPARAGLFPVADERDGTVRLHLPKGFRYRSFHDTEMPVTLTDGTALPGRHDGMGAFRGPGRSVLLVRNHEVNNPGPAFGPGTPYDAQARGGTTTIQVTPTGQVIRAFTSLNGTMMNCSGGPMPWGSWVTCEETVNGPDVGADFTGAPNVTLTKPHGYVFEVPVSDQPGRGQSNRQPIRSAGRFAHEAVSFDPRGGHLYLTEDNFAFPSGFYRYRPPRHPMRARRLLDGGTLQMLRVKGHDNAHLEAEQTPGTTYDVEWVDIPEPDVEYAYVPGQPAPTPNDTALVHVGDQGRAQGAAGFSRLEGQAYDRGVVYFTSTQGGGAAESGPDSATGYGNGSGQVWAYDVKRRTLTCVFQSPGPLVLDLPDNVTTSKRGTLVVCEDSSNDNFIRGLTRRGQLFDIALNRLTSSTGTHPLQRRVRRLDLRPDRTHPVRQHPGLGRDDVRDLGAVGADRGLAAESTQRRRDVLPELAVTGLAEVQPVVEIVEVEPAGADVRHAGRPREPGQQSVDARHLGRPRGCEHRAHDDHLPAVEHLHQPGEPRGDVGGGLVEVVQAALDHDEVGAVAERLGRPVGVRHLTAVAGSGAEARAGVRRDVHPALEPGRPRAGGRAVQAEAHGVGVADDHDAGPGAGVRDRARGGALGEPGTVPRRVGRR